MLWLFFFGMQMSDGLVMCTSDHVEWVLYHRAMGVVLLRIVLLKWGAMWVGGGGVLLLGG